jgi:Xaa-Pro aminopeptidase
MLTRARRIPPPPPEMSGQAMRIEFVSPFAKALKLAKARGATQLAQTALSLKELFPDIADNLNGDNLIATIHDGVSSDPSLIRDPREVQAMRQARAQAQAQQVQIEQMAQAASTYADVAHAQQAQTLAGGRKAKAA